MSVLRLRIRVQAISADRYGGNATIGRGGGSVRDTAESDSSSAQDKVNDHGDDEDDGNDDDKVGHLREAGGVAAVVEQRIQFRLLGRLRRRIQALVIFLSQRESEAPDLWYREVVHCGKRVTEKNEW